MPVGEMRPAAVFPLFFGMIYGFWGALGCAMANMIADLWYRIPVRGEEKSSFPKKDTTVHVLKYMLIILVDSAIVTILLGMEMKAFGIAEVFSKATFMMFLNNLDFFYVLGLPL